MSMNSQRRIFSGKFSLSATSIKIRVHLHETGIDFTGAVIIIMKLEKNSGEEL